MHRPVANVKRTIIKRPAYLVTNGKEYQTVHLIDALPYVFRAYFSLPSSIRDPSGRESNAVVGFANFLVNYIRDERPTHMALCFDKSLTTSFRNKLYPAYKSNRELPPLELKGQINRCRKFAEALGVKCFDDKTYEADDIICALSTSLTAQGHRCVIVTSDKDLYQLVGSQASVYDFAKGQRYDAAAVYKKMGVHPCQIVDLLGLMGDAVDCIPGVKGVGAKTAVFLLSRYDDLDDIYRNLSQVDNLPIRGAIGIRERLEVGKDMAYLSRRLATLAKKVPMKSRSLGRLKRKPFPRVRLHSLLDKFGLSRMHDRVDALG